MRPFFPYVGSKWSRSKHYPNPIGDTIIEPFAGSACYSVYYNTKHVYLYDIDPVICELWDYLIHVTEKELQKLPIDLYYGQSIYDMHIPIGAKHLIGFWMYHGSNIPSKIVTKRQIDIMNFNPKGYCLWDMHIIERISEQLEWIQHWKIFNLDYSKIENRHATWFIDPPYQKITSYKYKCYDGIDYINLAEFCKSREGCSIVCESRNADWLPFREFGSFYNQFANEYKELIWTQRNE